ncbi:MAG: D-alanine--D-alanine ligase family protein [Propionibacteriaceae bacterium]
MKETTKTRVALVFGGRSSEHAISCATAASVLEAIDHTRYEVVPVGVSREGHWVLMDDDPAPLKLGSGSLPEVPESDRAVVLPLSQGDSALRVVRPGEVPVELGGVDVVFPLLHGPFGEDGTIQGLLELAGIPYVGCGVTSSAVMMDKAFMKLVFAAAGLPQLPYEVITDMQWQHEQAESLRRCQALTFPVFVKPSRSGSSMGVTRVKDPVDLVAAIEAARLHDPKVIVEEGAFQPREIECGVLQGRAGEPHRVSPVGEITVSSHDFYDFEAKYLDENAAHLTIPAQIPAEVAAEVRRIAQVAFTAADCEGLARVDCFYDGHGRVIINEINTMPGFTPYSMYPQVWAAAGLAYPELINELIQLALSRRTGLR